MTDELVIYHKTSTGMYKIDSMNYSETSRAIIRDLAEANPVHYTQDIKNIFGGEEALSSKDLHDRAMAYWDCSWPTAHKRIVATGLEKFREGQSVTFDKPESNEN